MTAFIVLIPIVLMLFCLSEDMVRWFEGGWMVVWMNGWMDGQTDGRKDGKC